MATSFLLCSSLSSPLVSHPLLSFYGLPSASSNPFVFPFFLSNSIHGYRCQYCLETLPHASERLLQIQRYKPPGKRLSLPDGYEAVNGRATEGADRRSLGLERHSFGRREPFSRRGFCIMWLANSIPQLFLVNRFCILNIEKSNTSTCEPIVIFFSLLLPFFSCHNTSNLETKMGKETPKAILCKCT